MHLSIQKQQLIIDAYLFIASALSSMLPREPTKIITSCDIHYPTKGIFRAGAGTHVLPKPLFKIAILKQSISSHPNAKRQTQPKVP